MPLKSYSAQLVVFLAVRLGTKTVRWLAWRQSSLFGFTVTSPYKLRRKAGKSQNVLASYVGHYVGKAQRLEDNKIAATYSTDMHSATSPAMCGVRGRIAGNSLSSAAQAYPEDQHAAQDTPTASGEPSTFT